MCSSCEADSKAVWPFSHFVICCVALFTVLCALYFYMHFAILQLCWTCLLCSTFSSVLPSLTSCACQVFVCVSNQPTTINVSFILTGWFSSAWHSDVLIRTPPNHADTVCDLLVKSLTTPSRPSGLPATFTSLPSFSLIRLFSPSTIFLSLCLFRRLSLFHTDTLARTVHFNTFLCPDITHQRRPLSVGRVVSVHLLVWDRWVFKQQGWAVDVNKTPHISVPYYIYRSCIQKLNAPSAF